MKIISHSYLSLLGALYNQFHLRLSFFHIFYSRENTILYIGQPCFRSLLIFNEMEIRQFFRQDFTCFPRLPWVNIYIFCIIVSIVLNVIFCARLKITLLPPLSQQDQSGLHTHQPLVPLHQRPLENISIIIIIIMIDLITIYAEAIKCPTHKLSMEIRPPAKGETHRGILMTGLVIEM